ncbi:hypothetical protein CFC21_079153 [Triticum aestivum]|uniref:FBD domain-containing protein n=3 Tax=Triticinae TaxID=1648030 RepID=A0A9R1L1J6_WHEAT|nr:hypothetical protein CFC21_079153 [Triticum aestivum]
MIPINFTLPVRTVKILALESIGPNLDAVVGLLRCFPCTEKIYIQSLVRKDMKNVWQHDILDPIECLVHHLGKIVLEGYVGMRPDVNFAKFFVLNARVLKVMIFGLSDDRNEEWMANQHRRLQLDNRASRNARFDFKRVNGNRNMHIHDMRMPDPFDS